jgi:hypothetical protein
LPTQAELDSLSLSLSSSICWTAEEEEDISRFFLLENFAAQHPGFDFSSASVSGQLPADPTSFLRQ